MVLYYESTFPAMFSGPRNHQNFNAALQSPVYGSYGQQPVGGQFEPGTCVAQYGANNDDGGAVTGQQHLVHPPQPPPPPPPTSHWTQPSAVYPSSTSACSRANAYEECWSQSPANPLPPTHHHQSVSPLASSSPGLAYSALAIHHPGLHHHPHTHHPLHVEHQDFGNGGCGGDVGLSHSPDSGLTVSSDGGVSSSDSPQQTTTAAAPALNRPPLLRSPYEWMKKPSYQSQMIPGKTRTKDKYRVVYSDLQRIELEKEFCFSRYITIRRKAELAQMLGLSERQVKIWFQNRRAKERKQVKKREELQVLKEKEPGGGMHVGGHQQQQHVPSAKVITLE